MSAPPPAASARSGPSASTDSDAFDLSLVAESMSYMNKPTPAPTSSSDSSSTPPTSNDAPATPPDEDETEDPLANIDLSTLTPADRALLQPLLDLMGRGDGTEDEGDLSRRLDEAGDVASGLEGMLDGLLDRLGGMLGDQGGLEEVGEDGESKETDEKAEVSGDKKESS